MFATIALVCHVAGALLCFIALGRVLFDFFTRKRKRQ